MENNNYPVVEIFWKDHYSLGDEWYGDVSSQIEDRVISTSGYLVGQDDSYYYIACNYDFGTTEWSSGTAILKDCVISRRTLSKGDTPNVLNTKRKRTANSGKGEK